MSTAGKRSDIALRLRSGVIPLIADILLRQIDESSSFDLFVRLGIPMPGFHKIIPCAAIAALVLAGSSRITGQAPVENGRQIALAAAEDTLPAALERVDAMLTSVSSTSRVERRHVDSRPRHRAPQPVLRRLPVFGGHVVRQMDGRAVVSVTGRLYQSLALDVNPSISPERASAVAVAAVSPGAAVPGDATLGILPVENGYRLVYRMKVLSEWAIRGMFVAADSGDVLLSLNGIHTQAAVGQGSGFSARCRKMSTNQTSSTYQAVDKLRPARGVHARVPRHPLAPQFVPANPRPLQF